MALTLYFLPGKDYIRRRFVSLYQDQVCPPGTQRHYHPHRWASETQLVLSSSLTK